MTEEQKPVPERKQQPVEQSKGRWGLRGKTFWDWLQLLIVPIVLAVTAFILQDQADQRQQRIADERAKQEILNKYFDEMTDLLFEQKLRTAKPGSEAQIVARARTLTALRDLDSQRKGQLLRFLQEANLSRGDKPVIDLKGADLRDAYLRRAYLRGADLSEADLSEADLDDANLSDANLSYANLSYANLSYANLSYANLSSADLKGAYLEDAGLSSADLSEADLDDANLSDANLSYANLDNANLGGADLSYANLSYANLDNTNLSNASLTGAWFCKTKMPDGKENNQDCPY